MQKKKVSWLTRKKAVWLNEMKIKEKKKNTKRKHSNSVYNNISIIMVMLITIWCENDVLLWFWKCASECACTMQCNTIQHMKDRKKEGTFAYKKLSQCCIFMFSPPLSLSLSFIRTCIQWWVSGSTIWCISYIVYRVSAYTWMYISLFVSKVVHASQINATQTLIPTTIHTHITFSQTAPYQLFLSAINARSQNFCLHNQYTWHFRLFAIVEFML